MHSGEGRPPEGGSGAEAEGAAGAASAVEAGADTAAPQLPLAGVRVLDLSRVLAGPLCTMMLGDMGADVLKVERPGMGDETRGWGPPFDERGESAYFLGVNRNKLGVAADLGERHDRELILALAADADVVVDNFRPGALERLGIEPGELVGANPRLIWCTITGFGAGSDRPGYDFVIQAEYGWMAVTGAADGEAAKVGMALADVIAGKDACIAILAALARRGARAEPPAATVRRIFVSLAASAGAALINVAQNALVSGAEPRRWGNAHPNLVPCQLFQASDRSIVLAVGSDAQWQACVRAMELVELAGEAKFATNAGRVERRELVVARLAARFAEARADHWLSVLGGAGVPVGLVREVREVVRELNGSALSGMPPSVPGRVRLPPPRLDEHGSAVRRAGWGVFGG